MPRYALLHLSATKQNTLVRTIPPGYHLITQALKAFWELELQVSKKFIIEKDTADSVRFTPLAYNNFFKIKQFTAATLSAAGILRIDDLLDEDNKYHTWRSHYWQKISLDLGPFPNRIKTTIKLIRNTQQRIPKWFLTILRRKRSWNQPPLCGWRDCDDPPIYGLAINNKLHELHVNESGMGTPISTPHDRVDWNCEEHLQKISTNSIFTHDSKNPNCKEAWNSRLTLNGLIIDRAKVWESVGTFLTTPGSELARAGDLTSRRRPVGVSTDPARGGRLVKDIVTR
eukprot:6181098-Pleurochrysis_carterae.AAC.3